MDPNSAFGKILETLIVNYGASGLIIVVLLIVIWRLFGLYVQQVEKNNLQTIGYIESFNRNTAVVEGLREAIRIRGGDK